MAEDGPPRDEDGAQADARAIRPAGRAPPRPPRSAIRRAASAPRWDGAAGDRGSPRHRRHRPFARVAPSPRTSAGASPGRAPWRVEPGPSAGRASLDPRGSSRPPRRIDGRASIEHGRPRIGRRPGRPSRDRAPGVGWSSSSHSRTLRMFAATRASSPVNRPVARYSSPSSNARRRARYRRVRASADPRADPGRSPRLSCHDHVPGGRQQLRERSFDRCHVHGPEDTRRLARRAVTMRACRSTSSVVRRPSPAPSTCSSPNGRRSSSIAGCSRAARTNRSAIACRSRTTRASSTPSC